MPNVSTTVINSKEVILMETSRLDLDLSKTVLAEKCIYLSMLSCRFCGQLWKYKDKRQVLPSRGLKFSGRGHLVGKVKKWNATLSEGLMSPNSFEEVTQILKSE